MLGETSVNEVSLKMSNSITTIGGGLIALLGGFGSYYFYNYYSKVNEQKRYRGQNDGPALQLQHQQQSLELKNDDDDETDLSNKYPLMGSFQLDLPRSIYHPYTGDEFTFVVRRQKQQEMFHSNSLLNTLTVKITIDKYDLVMRSMLQLENITLKRVEKLTAKPKNHNNPIFMVFQDQVSETKLPHIHLDSNENVNIPLFFMMKAENTDQGYLMKNQSDFYIYLMFTCRFNVTTRVFTVDQWSVTWDGDTDLSTSSLSHVSMGAHNVTQERYMFPFDPHSKEHDENIVRVIRQKIDENDSITSNETSPSYKYIILQRPVKNQYRGRYGLPYLLSLDTNEPFTLYYPHWTSTNTCYVAYQRNVQIIDDEYLSLENSTLYYLDTSNGFIYNFKTSRYEPKSQMHILVPNDATSKTFEFKCFIIENSTYVIMMKQKQTMEKLNGTGIVLPTANEHDRTFVYGELKGRDKIIETIHLQINQVLHKYQIIMTNMTSDKGHITISMY